MSKNPKPAKVIHSKNSAELERKLAQAKQEELQAKAGPFMEEFKALCEKHGVTLQAGAQLQIIPYVGT